MSSIVQVGSYEVANIGARPHNLEGDDVLGLIEPYGSEDLTILTLKPGFYPRHPRSGAPLQRYMEGLVTAAQLDVLSTTETTLSGVDVCGLYRDVLPPNPEDDARFGTDWKRGLLSYMTSSTVFSYLLAGDNAFHKTHYLKNYVRSLNTVEGDETSKVIENVGHVPDPEDFDISLEILFLGGLAVNSLSDSQRI